MCTVIILHGLGRRSASMRKLARALEGAGYHTEVLDYPSTELSIKELVSLLEPLLPKDKKLHFVGHSLGGILSKKLAERLEKPQRGRVVQMGAPNFGSEIAARAAVFTPLMGPALAELAPHEGDAKNELDLGAIGGTAALPAYGVITGIEGENDGKVSLKSAWGHAPEDKRLALPVTHILMMQDRRVIAATIKFLQTGSFSGLTG
ncbi:MAG: alpha/beta hydrolase [Rhodobacteraceae bacterium]|nr:alpha/beta hydrolase [Paracoccaceae bacterium]